MASLSCNEASAKVDIKLVFKIDMNILNILIPIYIFI